MKRTGLFVASVMLSTTLWAQSPVEKGLNTINKENAEAYIGFLASDELEGREAGCQGGRIAAEYIVSNLKTMGIAPLNITNLSRLIIRNARRGDVSRCILIRSPN